MSSEEEKKNSEEVKDNTKETTEEYKKKHKLVEEILKLQEEQNKKTQEQLEAIREYSRILGDVEEQRNANLDLAKMEMQQILENSEQFKRITDERDRKKAIDAKILALMTDEAASLEDKSEFQKKFNQEKLKQIRLEYATGEGQRKYGKSQKQFMKDLTGALGISNNLGNSFLGKMIKVGVELQKGGKEAKLAFVENLKQSLSITKLLVSAIAKIAEGTFKMAMAADKAQAAFAKTTGAARDFSGVITDVQRQANLYGVSMDDAQKATAALFSGTTNFVNLSKSMQIALAANTAELERIGISAKTSAKMFQFLNLNLGMTTEQAIETTNRIATMSKKIGITSKQFTEDFAKSLGVLAVYGPRAEQVFSNLAGAAKAAGVETSKLLKIAGKFDTFKGSAETVAKFNALLGTQLSTTQMLLMTEDERIETLIRSVQASGRSFNEMNRFQQKAVAAAAGIDDLNEAQRIFGMNIDQYKDYQEQMGRNTDATKKMEKAVAATMDISNKFKVLAAEFILQFQPMLETAHEWLDSLRQFMNQFTPEQKQRFMKITMAVLAFSLALKVLGPIISLISTGIGIIGGGGVAAGGGLIASMTGFGASLVALLPVLAKVAAGLAILYVAWKGLQALGSWITGEEPSQAEKEAGGVKKLNAAVTPKVDATLSNLAALSTGNFKDSMTGAVVAARKIEIVSNLEGIFPDNLQLVIEDGPTLEAYIAKVGLA